MFLSSIHQFFHLRHVNVKDLRKYHHSVHLILFDHSLFLFSSIFIFHRCLRKLPDSRNFQENYVSKNLIEQTVKSTIELISMHKNTLVFEHFQKICRRQTLIKNPGGTLVKIIIFGYFHSK